MYLAGIESQTIVKLIRENWTWLTITFDSCMAVIRPQFGHNAFRQPDQDVGRYRRQTEFRHYLANQELREGPSRGL